MTFNFVTSNVFRILNHVKLIPVILTLVYLNISDICESFLDILLLTTFIIYLYSLFDFLEDKFSKKVFSDSINIIENEFNLVYFLERFYLRIKSSPFLALNWIICNIKLFFHWFFSKRLFYTFNFLKNLRQFHFIPVLWRPLIKKYSYYGYYAFNRTKWIITFFKNK